MNEKRIYDYFRNAGYTHNGSLALLGNILAESNGNPIAAENKDYNTYDYNPYDAVGYGLAQWTLAIRKVNLLNFCGEHYSDIDWQLKFCVHELTTEGEYAKLNRELRDENCELYYLVEQVCKIYERPKVNNVGVRFRYANIANIATESDKGSEEEVGIDEMTMLHKGSKGYEVKVMQSLLWMHGYQLETDGDFGNQTQAAVQSFQTRNNLDADGWVGPNTWRKLLRGV